MPNQFNDLHAVRKAVIGGIPTPIGGVTSFIYRLAKSGRVDAIFDVYQSSKKYATTDLPTKVFFLDGVLHFVRIYFLYLQKYQIQFFFNFSTTRALVLFLCLPKREHKFELMLHNGDLKADLPLWLLRVLLRKMDRVYCISTKQEIFYRSLGVPANKLVPCSSFIPLPEATEYSAPDATAGLTHKSTIRLLCSGYPTAIYNHDWVLEFVAEHTQFEALMFLYGPGDQKKELVNRAERQERVTVFTDVDAGAFNKHLAQVDIYVRPNTIDSFGIAVADAITLGTPVLASDVCGRFEGTYLFTPENYESFRSALLEVVSNPGSRPISNDQTAPVFLDVY